MPRVEAPRDCVLRIDIDADSPRIPFDKPHSQLLQQSRSNFGSPVLADCVNPLQLAVTLVSCRQMTGDVADRLVAGARVIHHARGQRLPRMARTLQVSTHARLGISTRLSRFRECRKYSRIIWRGTNDLETFCIDSTSHNDRIASANDSIIQDAREHTASPVRLHRTAQS